MEPEKTNNQPLDTWTILSFDIWKEIFKKVPLQTLQVTWSVNKSLQFTVTQYVKNNQNEMVSEYMQHLIESMERVIIEKKEMNAGISILILERIKTEILSLKVEGVKVGDVFGDDLSLYLTTMKKLRAFICEKLSPLTTHLLDRIQNAKYMPNLLEGSVLNNTLLKNSVKLTLINNRIESSEKTERESDYSFPKQHNLSELAKLYASEGDLKMAKAIKHQITHREYQSALPF